MAQISYARQWINGEEIEAVASVLRSEYLTQGPLVDEFENAVAAYCGAKYAVAVNSGTSALHIACLAAGIEKGDEVITTPITFVATPNAVLYCGGTPVFADVKEENAIINPIRIEEKVNKKTKAIIPVDFAGHPSDMLEIKRIADKNGLVVIEDAAHSLGAKYRGDKVGSAKYADMTILSFHAVKHITTGEGGMVLTNNKKYYNRLKKFRTHGITRAARMFNVKRGAWYYEMSELGFNYRLTDIQSALGVNQLKRLPYFLRKRKEIVARYNSIFAENEYIIPLRTMQYVDNAFHLYVVRFNLKKMRASRRQIFDEYRSHGIIVNVHYIPVYWQPYYRKLGYCQGLCPNAEAYYEEAITLPLFPKMSDLEFKRVIKVTESILDKYSK